MTLLGLDLGFKLVEAEVLPLAVAEAEGSRNPRVFKTGARHRFGTKRPTTDICCVLFVLDYSVDFKTDLKRVFL